MIVESNTGSWDSPMGPAALDWLDTLMLMATSIFVLRMAPCAGRIDRTLRRYYQLTRGSVGSHLVLQTMIIVNVTRDILLT
jgi:hypothetical protein